MRRVIAVDPGLASGCAILSLNDVLTVQTSVECELYDLWVWLNQILKDWPKNEPPAVAVERFTITAHTAQNSQAPWSLEATGMVRGLVWHHFGRETPLTLQSPVDAKSMFPNPRLKLLGLWHRGGAGHARDAIRHGALYMVRNGWWDKRLADPY